MTKEYVKNNWNNIILVDTSGGQSIHGVSIFFNRYIGNIKLDANCTDIKNAQPLKFIFSGIWKHGSINVDPKKVEQLFNKSSHSNKKLDKNYNTYLNYNPNLITYLGATLFYHAGSFYIDEVYPRYVPSYIIPNWDKNPESIKNDGYDLAISNLVTLKKIYVLYKNKSKENAIKLLSIINSLNNKITIKHNDDNIGEKVYKLMDNYNKKLVLKKYYPYYEINGINN